MTEQLIDNPFIAKLTHSGQLAPEDRQCLQGLSQQVRAVAAREDLIDHGDRPEQMHLIMEGIACRYKLSETGERHIVAYFLPGDFCDLRVWLLDHMDHSIGTLTPCSVVDIWPDTLQELTDTKPRITRALWWASLVSDAIEREWIFNLADRETPERLAHLLCEFRARFDAIGRANGNEFQLPLTQIDLAASLGVSAVHVNRVLQELRQQRLVEFRNRTVRIFDLARLQEFASFNPDYLHVRERK